MRTRAWWLLGVVLLGTVALRFGLADGLPVICPLRRLTGIPCAGCGMTRAAAALCHGEWVQAAAFNIAALPLAALLGVLLGLLVCEAVTERAFIRPAWQRCSSVVTWLLVALMLAAWAVNLWRHFS